ncbi:hypothetical protein AB0899_18195 [Streptomyces sp. NPDC007002]|uniref:hypothetical protein n=1 Tax=Streptomyces sp. NPDC007002 TaxID=3156910 RepID=UPI003451DBB7
MRRWAAEISPAARHPRRRVQLRTTNPVEPACSTVGLRTGGTRGVGSPAVALATVFTLAESAQEHRRAIASAHLVALVRAGARCEEVRRTGFLMEREEAAAA